MATLIDKVIEVTLAYGTAVIETARFDIPLILAAHNATGNVVDVFTSSDAMLQAGFTTESPAYKMASLMFQGVGAPGQVIVGKRDVANFNISFTAQNSTLYTVTLKKGATTKVFNFTSDASATATEIATGLSTLIAADATWGPQITATVGTGNTLVLTPVSGSHIEVGVGNNTTITRAAVNNVLEDISAVAQENNTWFWMVSDTHQDEDVLDLAGYAQEHDKIYWTSSQDPAIVNADEGNLLSELTGRGYNNTGFAMWRTDADSLFPEAAIVGAMAAADPGTTTLHGKTLVGVTPQQLTPTQETNIVAQNGNIYRREYGVNFYRDGRMVSGNFCDVIHHALWVKARVAESLFGLLKRQSDLLKGVRFTSKGLAQIKQAIFDNPINIGLLNGSIANEINVSEETGLKEDLRPTIFVPDRADISIDDITQRILNGVVVEYVYAGFIHYVKVKVNVLVDR
jgi:hypothetical protein